MSMLWACVFIGVATNLTVNYFQQVQNNRSIEDRDAIHRDLQKLEARVKELENR